MPSVGFVYHDCFLEHGTPAGHPESPERLRHLLAYLRKRKVWETLRPMVPVPASVGRIAAVHSLSHIEKIAQLSEQGGGALDDGDTYGSVASYRAAAMAAGAVVTAVDAVLQGRVSSAFCAVRPPGHHAEQNRAMGFCLFNNVAVGARYAQQAHGIGNVAILDWDVHHGNGTQHTFEDDPSVLYISLHQYPFYPGTGARRERGVGRGEGFTMNFPLPAGTGEMEYLKIFHDEIVPALRRFKPGLLILSAGFDAHRDDLLGGMKLTEGSFAKLTARVQGIAPIVSVLEGGYHLDALAASVERHLEALLGG